ncbi:MAG: RNA polymerase sigma factor [Eubacterium sp.]|jgi:RNA polymerase sigma-70 factor (ECF subfamily)|nr:RNA polymerase sigma factor [Eubacterium sp.]
MTDFPLLSLCTRDNFESVIELYLPMVYRLAFSRVKNIHDANDISQEVFLKYMRADKTYNDENHRKAWLIKTTVNTSKTMLLSSWNKRRADIDSVPEKGEDDKSILDLELQDTVYSAVMELPKNYRTVIHLFYYEDMPVNTISKILGKPKNTVKSHLYRARAVLKEKLEGVEFDEI